MLRIHVTLPIVVASAALALALAPAAGATCAGSDLTYSVANEAQMADAVTCLVNAERTARGLPALSRDTRLDSAARGHSADMAGNDYFDHDSQDGTKFSARITNVGYTWVAAGENIAAGQRTPKSVMTAWMASTGHCQNILSGAYADIGVGLAPGGSYGLYWTQDFARRSGGAPSAGAASGCPFKSLTDVTATPAPGATACATTLKIDSARRAAGEMLRVKGRIGPSGCAGKLRFTVRRGSKSVKRTKKVSTRSFTIKLRLPGARGNAHLTVKLGDTGPTVRRTVKL